MPLETLTAPARASSLESVWIEVNLTRILGNLERLRLKIRPFSRVMAVVKANAYGHGLVPVAKALQGKVDFLGLGSVKEASILREQGIPTPLFLFGRLLSDQIPLALAMNLTLTVSSVEEAEEISEVARKLSKEACVHIKVDTGMGRLGLPLGESVAAMGKMAKLPQLRLEGIYTHFPVAERAGDPFSPRQVREFERLIEDLRRKGISFSMRHAANSAGALRFQSPHLNLVRPGLALYGLYPHASLEKEIVLEPALALKTRIIFLKRIQEGESVGYGRTFVATRPTTVAVLPVGYAHGIPFQLSNQGEVLYAGGRLRIAGRVCMDSMVVDLGQTAARVGDEVTLLGDSEGETIRAEEVASLAHTIPYEIVTRLDLGIPRYYTSSS